MERIILISGKAESGKDLTANLMKEKLEENGKKVLITHYADLLKYIGVNFFEWNNEKDAYGRSLLQKIGQKVREKDKDYWVNSLLEMIGFSEELYDYIIISDVRYLNEIQKMQEKYGDKCFTVRVERDGHFSKLTKEQKQHSSETSLDYYSFNVILKNNSTEDKFKQLVYKYTEYTFLGNKTVTIYL